MEEKKTYLADSHVHLSHGLFNSSFPYFRWEGDRSVREENGTRETLIDKMKEQGIRFCVEPAVELESNERLLALAERCPGYVLPAVGIHPTRTFSYYLIGEDGKQLPRRLPWKARAQVARYADNERVVAIGETGLDFHQPRAEQHRFRQIVWFLWQLGLAHRKRLPVILHIREADRLALPILRLMRRFLHGGVCHCFSGTPRAAERYTSLGLKLGIGAALLAEGEQGCRLTRVVRQTRLEDILLETDGPFQRPPCPELSEKRRNKTRNTSLILPGVAKRIAEIKGVSQAQVEQVTGAAAAELFGATRFSDRNL